MKFYIIYSIKVFNRYHDISLGNFVLKITTYLSPLTTVKALFSFLPEDA